MYLNVFSCSVYLSGSNESLYLKPLYRYDYYLDVEKYQFADYLHETYTILFLILVGIVMLDLSFTGAELALHADSFEQVVRFAAEAMAEIVHFYFNSLPCQRIIGHSLSVNEALYSCRWYGISLQARKILGFMLLRSTKPCIITAAHVYAMSMENFSSVLQASMPYFTMLTSMQ